MVQKISLREKYRVIPFLLSLLLAVAYSTQIPSISDARESKKKTVSKKSKPSSKAKKSTSKRNQRSKKSARKGTKTKSKRRKKSKSKVYSPKDTIIGSIGVFEFHVNTKRPKLKAFLNKNQRNLSRVVSDLLNKNSSIYAKSMGRVFKRGKKQPKYRVSGIITGHFKGNVAHVQLRNTSQMRVLAEWSIPLERELSGQTLEKLSNDVVDAVINSIPYQGWVTTVSGDKVKLKLGRGHTIKKGDKLRLFQFASKKPTFSTQQELLGEVTITKINKQVAIGTLATEEDQTVPVFAKVALKGSKLSYFYDSKKRYGRRWWAAAGGQGSFFNTQSTNTDLAISRRLYQIILSPFINFAGGYKKFAMDVSYGFLGNENQETEFTFFDGSYEFSSWVDNKYGYVITLGFGGSNISVTPKPGQATTLNKSSSLYFSGQQYINWVFSPRGRIFVHAGLLYPIYSIDPENGQNLAHFSVGARGGVGLRVHASDNIAFETSIVNDYSLLTFQGDRTIAESHFTIGTKVYTFF